MGIISVTNMTSKITKGKVKPTDSVTVMLYKKFDLVSIIPLCAIFVIHLLLQINPSTTLVYLFKDHFAIVTDAPLTSKITYVGGAALFFFVQSAGQKT